MHYSCSPLNITPLNRVSRKENMNNEPTKREVSTRFIYGTISRYSSLIIPKWSTNPSNLVVELISFNL
jgi:hypothetical protein